ncbi:Fe-S metabolism protein SufE [Rhodothermaceae bacterium RA]|nr:Fe-S metabolism protein SufE [Rhodothermaceae bacterium RA]
MSTIAEREQEIIDAFALFDDWMGRYEYLIDLGRELPPLDAAYKTDAYKIHGCQSQVWIRAEERDGRIYYEGDSDALITRGLVALLIRVLSGQPADAIIEADLKFLDRIGMQEHLSPTRKNGLASMIKQMKLYALAHGQTTRS